MAVIGPGAAQEAQTDIKATLDGASEYEVVTVLNPLSDDFAVRVAQDVPVNMPFEIRQDATGKTASMTKTEQDATSLYGLSLKNPDFQGRKHIVIDTIIPSGQTRNFKGSEAQVAVRQLVNEIMQREGNQRLMSDPMLRQEVEGRVIISRGSIQDLMDEQLQSPRSQMDAALAKSNEVQDEQAFPGLDDANTGSGESGQHSGTESSTQERRSPGRPRKTATA